MTPELKPGDRGDADAAYDRAVAAYNAVHWEFLRCSRLTPTKVMVDRLMAASVAKSEAWDAMLEARRNAKVEVVK